MKPYQPRNGSKTLLALLLLGFSSTAVAAESYWVTVFDLQLQVGDKDTVRQQPAMKLLGPDLELPREFSSWHCSAGEIHETKIHISTRYLECTSGRSTVYTQVTCQTSKADNNSSSIIVRSRTKTALFTLSCQSFISDPGQVESGL